MGESQTAVLSGAVLFPCYLWPRLLVELLASSFAIKCFMCEICESRFKEGPTFTARVVKLLTS